MYGCNISRKQKRDEVYRPTATLHCTWKIHVSWINYVFIAVMFHIDPLGGRVGPNHPWPKTKYCIFIVNFYSQSPGKLAPGRPESTTFTSTRTFLGVKNYSSRTKRRPWFLQWKCTQRNSFPQKVPGPKVPAVEKLYLWHHWHPAVMSLSSTQLHIEVQSQWIIFFLRISY